MWQIVYTDETRKKLSQLDQVVQRQICDALKAQSWHKFSAQTSWLRFISDFSQSGCRNYRILCKVTANKQLVNILDIVFERGLYTVLR